MFQSFIYVGFGGFLGCISRFYIGQLFTQYYPSKFPIATLVVNFFGCLIAGYLFHYSNKTSTETVFIKQFLTIGFCGGFTTFSTFGIEVFSFLAQNNWIYAISYVIASVVLGLLALYFGYNLYPKFMLFE